ncbi:MAG: hypothetical protein DBY34_04700 [Oscillospiraceae bacterium]|nr:MAG: hypothetical protein DBY34_04700 [Oscillospiraceae bacterium]
MQLFLFRISSCADLVKGKRKKCNQLLQKWAKKVEIRQKINRIFILWTNIGYMLFLTIPF